MTRFSHMFVALFVVCAWVLTTSSSAFAANLHPNGGFETAGVGGAADSADWNEFGTDAGSGTVSQRVSSGQASGSFAHELNAVGSAALGGHTAGINFTTASLSATSLQPGTSVNLTFDANVAFNGVGDIGFFAVRILNGVGAVVADSGLQMINTPTGGSYQSFSLNAPVLVPAFGATPNDTYYAFMEITANAGATAEGSNPVIFVDNVVFTGTLVPEPATLGLLALGGLVMIARRRHA